MNKSEIVYHKLKIEYPDANCALNYETPFQLLISTVLSAQSTDKSVNAVTSELYKDFPDLEKFLTLSQDEIAEKIKKIGIYKNKSKSIFNLCRELKDNFNGKVPCEMQKLVKLSGVGRKTASVVLAEAFGVPAMPVDTHVFRVSKRIGFAKGKDADAVSDEIMKKLPKKYWINAHHLFISHGRQICSAKNPKCELCVVKENCNFFKTKN